MRPLLAAALFILVCHIHLSATFSDRAALGARLMRSIEAKSKAKQGGKTEADTLSAEMKKQMKRIDALEDIFVGSSGSPKAKKSTKVNVLSLFQ